MLTPEQRMRQLRAYLGNQRFVQLAYFIGNSSKSDTSPVESIDLAVLFNTLEPQWYENRQKLLEGAIWIFGVSSINIVILNECEPAIAHRYLLGGQLIYQRDSSSRAKSEKRVIKTFLDTERLRSVHAELTKEAANDAQQLN